ncbi:MAG: TasA family protein [Actinomycetota bacterium]
MDSTEDSQRRRRYGAAFAVFALALTTMVIGLTGAIFTDTSSDGASTFTTGSIDISTTPATAILTASTMAPGDTVENDLTVSNDGSLELRYAIQGSATDDANGLSDTLKVRIAAQGGGACNFPYFDTAGAPTGIGDDTQLYTATGFPATATNFVGDIAVGSQLGDRALSAASDEELCFSVVLPLAAGNGLQDATTTATFDFVAEQVANN